MAKPDGLLVVPPDGKLDFLHPLAVERLWGVGPVTSKKLREYDVKTVDEITSASNARSVADCQAPHEVDA